MILTILVILLPVSMLVLFILAAVVVLRAMFCEVTPESTHQGAETGELVKLPSHRKRVGRREHTEPVDPRLLA